MKKKGQFRGVPTSLDSKVHVQVTMKESYLGDRKQAKYQSGSQYKPLAMGSSILYYDHDKSQWVPGVLVEKIHDRSYVIISQKGRKVYQKIELTLKPYPGKVQVHFETPKVPMTSPIIMSKTGLIIIT